MRFVEKIISTEGGLIRLILASQHSQEVWFFLHIDPAQYGAYQQAILSGETEALEKYGRVLIGGYGETPPKVIEQYIQDTYG